MASSSFSRAAEEMRRDVMDLVKGIWFAVRQDERTWN
jgi:hypothetical protein